MLAIVRKCNLRDFRWRSSILLTFLAAVAASVFLVSCGAGTYLDSAHPVVFKVCPSKSIQSPQEHAYNAIMYSLQDRGWVVKQAEPHRLVRAVACTSPSTGQSADFLKRYDTGCVTMTFEVQGTGVIRAFNADDERMNLRGVQNMKDWIRSLERVYSIHRCFSDDVLKKGTAVPSSVQTD